MVSLYQKTNNTMLSLKSLCVLTFTLSFSWLSAQNLYDESFRNWDEGPVKWSDFRVSRAPDDAKYVSELSCVITQEVERTKIGNFRFPVLKTTTQMNKLASWYDPDKCTDWTLRYEQIRFDMLEVLRIRLQNSFNRNFFEKNLDAYYDQLITSTMVNFERESNFGTDTLVVRQYEERYKQELDTLKPEPVQVPVFEKKDWGVALNVGVGNEIFGSPMSKGVTPATGIEWGFGVLYKQMSFGLDFLLAWSGNLQCDNFYYDSKYDYNWTKGKRVSAGNININGGFRVYDGSNLSVTPLVGIGVSFVDQDSDTPRTNNNNSFENSEISGFRTQAGLAFDWKMRRSLNANYYSADYTESKIRFAITGARSNFKGIGPTYSLNASIVFLAESWNLK